MKKIKSNSLTHEAEQAIYQYIRENYDGENTKLPTEEQFSQLLGVSRNTVRAALNELSAKGFIFRRHGTGTFVNREANEMKVSFSPVSLFTQMIQNYGYSPSIQLLPYQIIPADKKIANILGLAEGDDLIFTRKIFFADGKPCSYCEDYFSADLFESEDILNDLNLYENSLFEFLYEKTNRNIIWDKTQILTCTNQDMPDLSTYFQCNPTDCRSFLLLQCINFDQDDHPIVFAHEYIDTNYIQFNSIRYKNWV